jgi:glutamate/aspartate transport system substrate-binding protein
VDATLTRFYQTDDYQRLYKKWFMSPIPPKGINLNFPMPPQLQAVLAKPTDSPDPAVYAAVPSAQQAAARKKGK